MVETQDLWLDQKVDLLFPHRASCVSSPHESSGRTRWTCTVNHRRGTHCETHNLYSIWAASMSSHPPLWEEKETEWGRRGLALECKQMISEEGKVSTSLPSPPRNVNK